MEGIHNIKPVITKLLFNDSKSIAVYLKDGWVITAPLRYFQGIKKLSPQGRRPYRIVNDEIIMFSGANEIYHLQDFLGKEQEYRYAG